MLEVCGRGYAIDYCISSLRKYNRELEFRVYVTDALKFIAENTAKKVGGSFISQRYYELIKPQKEQPKSADIISKIKKKMRGGAGE